MRINGTETNVTLLRELGRRVADQRIASSITREDLRERAHPLRLCNDWKRETMLGSKLISVHFVHWECWAILKALFRSRMKSLWIL